jgi:hypothetical protein
MAVFDQKRAFSRFRCFLVKNDDFAGNGVFWLKPGLAASRSCVRKYAGAKRHFG